MMFQFFIFCRILFGPSNKRERISHESLVLNDSFELSLDSNKDRWIIFREYTRTLKRIYTSVPVQKELETNFNSLLLNNKPDNERRLARWTIDNFDGVKPRLLISESLWNNISLGTRVFLSLYLTLLAIPSVFFSFSKRNRSGYALVFRSFASIYLLLKYLPSEGTFKVFDFIPFSNESNVRYLLIKSYNDQIEVVKVPSVVPLVAHMKNLLTDTFVISTPYQSDELKAFNDTMIYTRVLRMLPKHSTYLKKYQNNFYCTESNKVGFYSHASWLRKEQNHAKTIFGNADLEGELLDILLRVVRATDAELVIFTHPRERDESIRGKVLSYYKSIAEGHPVTIDFENLSSSSSFEKVDIGFGTMSSILFERLLCGFKTYFFIKGMHGFPVENSSIEHICFSTEDDLKILLSKGLGQSTDEYFDQYGIGNYRSSSPFYF